jgi:tRNA threonylcarbamoyladenosine biosynthesis protein TsaE
MATQPQPEHSGFVSRSAEQTLGFGARLGEAAEPGDLLLLRGAFGAGKTTLVQGIAAGLGVREYVTSPSFTLINEYRSDRMTIYHIDLFRLERLDPELEQAVQSCEEDLGLTIVEWPDILPADLKGGGLRIDMEITGDDERSIIVHTTGTRWRPEEIVEIMERTLRSAR